MNWLWYPANGGYSFILWYPNQWGLFIGILIPTPMEIIHWYSDTQPMGVIHWYSVPKPKGVIHWYSDAQSREYSVTIVIRLLRIWITFEHLNYFESLKLHMWFWKCLSIFELLWVIKTAYVFLEPIVSYSFWYMKNWLLSKPFIIYL